MLIDGNALPDLNVVEPPPIEGKLYYVIDVYDFNAGALSKDVKLFEDVLVSVLFTTLDVLSVSFSFACEA